jgi:CHAT domain-containing protein
MGVNMSTHLHRLLAALALALALFGGHPAQAQTRAEVEATIAQDQSRLAQAIAATGENSEAASDLLFSLGLAYSSIDRLTEARDMYQRAAKSVEAQRGPENALLGAMLNNLAGVYDDMGQYEEARKNYARAFELFAKGLGTKNKFTLRAANSLAGVMAKLDNFEKAQQLYEFALPRRIEVHGAESKEALRTKAGLARVLMVRGQYAAANQHLREMLEIYRRTRAADDDDTLGAMLDMASTFVDLGDPDSAMNLAQRVVAARLAKHGPDDPRTLTAQGSVANVLNYQGRFAESLALHEHVLATRLRTLGPQDDSITGARGNVAFALKKVGRLEEAKKIEFEIATERERVWGFNEVGTLLLWMAYADTLGQLGQYAQAGLLQERIIKGLSATLGQSNPITLGAIGSMSGNLYEVGDWQRSAEIEKFVVDGRTRVLGAQHRDTLASQHNLALRLIKTGELDKARGLLEAAVAVIEGAAPAHAAVVDLPYYYRTLGELYVAQGQQARAREVYRRSLALAERTMGPDHPLTANVATFLAKVVTDPAKRVQLYSRALRISRATSTPGTAWRAADGLRATYQEMKVPAVAILYGKQAINTLQGLRQNLAELDKGMQKSFLTDKRQVYTDTADLLIAQGRLAEGQQVMAMLKQDEYFDFVNRSGKEDAQAGQLSLNPQEAAWVARYAAVSERLVEVSKAKAALDAKARTGSLSDDEKAQRLQYEGDLKAAREAFDAATKQVVEDARRFAASNGGEQRLGSEVIDSVRAMRSDLRQLGHGAVLVHYLIAEEKLWILLTTPEVQVARESRIRAADLNRRISEFREALRNPRSDVLPQAQALYRTLLGPIARDLEQAQARTLMLSLDGALRYVPFGALHDGRNYAVDRFRIALLTEAAKSKIKDLPQAEWTMVGLGLTKAVDGFSALPAVREELRGIVKGSGGVMAGEAHMDEAFTVERVKSALADSPPVLHIASHFKFTPGTEADSYLVLGDGGHLSLQQIRQDDMQFNVDLLTLSACETAVGDNARGQEVEGLGALAQKQGAKAVLATLWPVADASTGIFMREMYRRRAEDKLTKAEAIRQVQRAFLAGEFKGGGSGDRGARTAQDAAAPRTAPAAAPLGYAHPFYWAPFILMGNWL